MTAPDVNADVRARFEAIAKDNDRNLVRYPDGRYVSPDTSLAWHYYRAALADLAGEVRELVEADEQGTAFVDGLGWVVQCSRAVEYVAALAKFHPTHQEKP